MKDRMERLVFLPFTAGCVSSSSVSICIQHGRRSKEDKDSDSSHTVCRSREFPNYPKDASSDHMMRESSRLPTLSKHNIHIGFHRLTRSIKSFSQSLVFKEEMEEMEMEIGLPTDVKHVTHIGFDGSKAPGANGCNNLVVSDFVSLCPNFMAQYEQHAMTVPTDETQDTSCKSPDVRKK